MILRWMRGYCAAVYWTMGTAMPIISDHVVAAESLPLIHKDPFDRVLVAQASVEGVTLLTIDSLVSADEAELSPLINPIHRFQIRSPSAGCPQHYRRLPKPRYLRQWQLV